MPLQNKLSVRPRQLGFLLLVLAALALLTALFAHLGRPKPGVVAEARGRSVQAQQALLMTLRATTATEAFVQRPGLSNSSVAQTIHAIRNSLVDAATRRAQTAQIGLSLS